MKNKTSHRLTSFVLAIILVLTSSDQSYLQELSHIIKRKYIAVNREPISEIIQSDREITYNNPSPINKSLNSTTSPAITISPLSNLNQILNIDKAIQEIKQQAKIELVNTNIYENYQTDEIYNILEFSSNINTYTKEKIEAKQLKLSLEIKDDANSTVYSSLDIYNDPNTKVYIKKMEQPPMHEEPREMYTLNIQNKLLNTLPEKSYTAEIKLYINPITDDLQIISQEDSIIKKIIQPFKYSELNQDIRGAKQDIKGSIKLNLDNIEATDKYIFSLSGEYISKNDLLKINEYIGDYNLSIRNTIEDEEGNEEVIFSIIPNNYSMYSNHPDYEIIEDYEKQEDKYIFDLYLSNRDRLKKGKYKFKSELAFTKPRMIMASLNNIQESNTTNSYNTLRENYLSNHENEEIYIDLNQQEIIPLYEKESEIYIDEFEEIQKQTIDNLKNNLEFKYSDNFKKEISISENRIDIPLSTNQKLARFHEDEETDFRNYILFELKDKTTSKTIYSKKIKAYKRFVYNRYISLSDIDIEKLGDYELTTSLYIQDQFIKQTTADIKIYSPIGKDLKLDMQIPNQTVSEYIMPLDITMSKQIYDAITTPSDDISRLELMLTDEDEKNKTIYAIDTSKAYYNTQIGDLKFTSTGISESQVEKQSDNTYRVKTNVILPTWAKNKKIQAKLNLTYQKDFKKKYIVIDSQANLNIDKYPQINIKTKWEKETMIIGFPNNLIIDIKNISNIDIPNTSGYFKPVYIKIYKNNEYIKTIYNTEILKGKTLEIKEYFWDIQKDDKIKIEVLEQRFQDDNVLLYQEDIKIPKIYERPTIQIQEPTEEKLSGDTQIKFLLNSNEYIKDNYKITIYRSNLLKNSYNTLTEDIKLTQISNQNGYITYQGISRYDFGQMKNEDFYLRIVAIPNDKKYPDIVEYSDKKYTQNTSDVDAKITGDIEYDEIISKKGQTKQVELKITNNSRLADEITIDVLNQTDQQINIDKTLKLPSKQTKTYTFTLKSDQVQDGKIKIDIISKTDNRRITKQIRYKVEEQSDLEILRQEESILAPVGEKSNDYILKIQNNNLLKDEVELEFESDDVNVHISDNNLILNNKGIYTKVLNFTPNKEGTHTIIVRAKSKNDPTKIYQSQITLSTRALILDSFMTTLSTTYLDMDEKEKRKVELYVHNTSDKPLYDINIDAKSDIVMVNLDKDKIESIEPNMTKIITATIVQKDEIENDQIGQINFNISHKQNKATNKLKLYINKLRPILTVNSNYENLRTSTNLNSDAVANLIIQNTGKKIMTDIDIKADDKLKLAKTKIDKLDIGQKEIIKITIPKQLNKEIGQKDYNLTVNTKDKEVKTKTRKIILTNTVVNSNKGALELKVLDALSRVQKTGTVKLIHTKIPSITKEFDLKNTQDSGLVNLTDLMVGTYDLYILKEGNRKLNHIQVEIKPDLMTKIQIQLDIYDKLFDANFDVEKIKITETHTAIITTIEKPGPPILPKVEISGIKEVLRKGETKHSYLEIKNIGNYTVNRLNISTLVETGKTNENISIAIGQIQDLTLKPNQTYKIPVILSASPKANSTDQKIQNIIVDGVSDELQVENKKVGVFAKNKIIVSIIGGEDTNISLKPEYGYIIPKVEEKQPKFEEYQDNSSKNMLLQIGTKVENQREILDAKLKIENIKQDLNIKDITVHIQNSEGEDISEQFYQKNYKGNEYVKDAVLKQDQIYDIAWYIVDEKLDIEHTQPFSAYANIIYEVNGQEVVEKTNKVIFTLDPKPQVYIDIEVPNYLVKNRNYEIKAIINNKGKGDLKALKLKGINLTKQDTTIPIGFDTTNIDILKAGETVTLTTTIRSDKNVALTDMKLTKTYENSLGLDITPLIRDIRLKIRDTNKDAIKEYLRKNKGGHPASCINDPIDLSTGSQVIQHDIMELSGTLPLKYTLSYNSSLTDKGENGNGWSSIYDMSIELTTSRMLKPDLNPDELIVKYNNTKKNTFTKEQELQEKAIYITKDVDRNQDIIEKTNQGYTLIKKDGVRYKLNKKGKIEQIIYKQDQIITIEEKAKTNNTLKEKLLKDKTTGKYIKLIYNSKDMVEKVIDGAGRIAYLTYDNKDNLIKITDINNNDYIYTYDEENRILTGTNQNGDLVFKNKYDENSRIIHQTDQTNNNTKIEYTQDETNLIAKVTDRNGNIKTYTHDIKTGRLIRLEDELGVIINQEYDQNGNLIKQTDPNGNSNIFTYDEDGNMIKATDKQGNDITMSYDEQGNMTQIIDPKGNTTRYEYDDKGKLTQIINPLNQKTNMNYDNQGILKDIILQNGSQINYQIKDGKITSYQDENNNKGQVEYDDIGNIIQITDQNNDKIQISYTKDGKIQSITDKKGNKETYQYDKIGNLISQIDKRGNKTSYTYDLYKNITSKTNPKGQKTTYTYDNEQRLIQITNPDQTTRKMTYDIRGNLISITDENNNTKTMTYDKAGNLTQITDEIGNITTYQYNKIGNLIKINLSNNNQINYEYDQTGNLISITDSIGTITVNSYDKLNRLITTIDQKGNKISYEYDELGNLSQITDKKGAKTKNNYQNKRLIEQITKTGHKYKYSYNNIGQITQITDENNNAYQINYDKTGNITKIIDPLNQEENYKYDELGNLISYQDKKSNQTTYQYDEIGNLIKTTLPSKRQTLYTYDQRNRLIKIEQKDNKGNTHSQITMSYDKKGNLISQTDEIGNQTIMSYDRKGNLTNIKDDIGQIASYTYDAQGNKTSTTDSQGNKEIYSYDLRGNLTQITDKKGNKTTITYDELGQITKVEGEQNTNASYQYDEEGNITKITIKENEIQNIYDETGRLIQNNQTIGKIKRQTKYSYTSDNLIEQITNAKGQNTKIYYDKLRRITKIQEEDDTTTYQYDQNNNITKITNKDGQITRTYNNEDQITSYTDTKGNKISYSYDNIGNLSQITYPKANSKDTEIKINYQYDKKGNLTKVTDHKQRQTNYSYDKRSRQTSWNKTGQQQRNKTIQHKQPNNLYRR